MQEWALTDYAVCETSDEPFIMAEYILRVACVWKALLEELYFLEYPNILFLQKMYFVLDKFKCFFVKIPQVLRNLTRRPFSIALYFSNLTSKDRSYTYNYLLSSTLWRMHLSINFTACLCKLK